MTARKIEAPPERPAVSGKDLMAIGLLVMLAIGSWTGWSLYAEYLQIEHQRSVLKECESLQRGGKSKTKRYEYLQCEAPASGDKAKP